MNFEQKATYTMEDLLQITEILRAPGGCPWDREQTHKSIRNNFIEETYEAVEAIDTENRELLQEELGDVLFQVVFHAQLEKEAGSFSFADVVDGVAKKLIERHPHVFGDVRVSGTSDVLKNWDAIKQRTKGRNTLTEVLEGVSPALPALMRSQKVRRKAAKAEGPNLSQETALSELDDAEQSLRKISASSDEKDRLRCVGKLLFAAAALSESLGVESEQALAQYCDFFIEGVRRKGK